MYSEFQLSESFESSESSESSGSLGIQIPSLQNPRTPMIPRYPRTPESLRFLRFYRCTEASGTLELLNLLTSESPVTPEPLSSYYFLIISSSPFTLSTVNTPAPCRIPIVGSLPTKHWLEKPNMMKEQLEC